MKKDEIDQNKNCVIVFVQVDFFPRKEKLVSFSSLQALLVTLNTISRHFSLLEGNFSHTDFWKIRKKQWRSNFLLIHFSFLTLRQGHLPCSKLLCFSCAAGLCTVSNQTTLKLSILYLLCPIHQAGEASCSSGCPRKCLHRSGLRTFLGFLDKRHELIKTPLLLCGTKASGTPALYLLALCLLLGLPHSLSCTLHLSVPHNPQKH